MLSALSRLPAAEAIVTVSADVAVTTHLAGWINRKGIYFPETRRDFSADVAQTVRWQESRQSQHIELGIAEPNLFLLLGALGLSHELNGVTLLPIGTLYDPFVLRGLDALYDARPLFRRGLPGRGHPLGRHSGSRGRRPSVRDHSRHRHRPARCGLLRAGLRRGGRVDPARRARGHRSPYRGKPLPAPVTRAIDQRAGLPRSDELREQVLAGGYRLIDVRTASGYDPEDNAVHLFAAGVAVAEAVVAAESLREHGIFANVFVVTSADRLYRGLRAPRSHLERLVGGDEEGVPIVSVIDGHSHALAFLGSALGVTQIPLGVDYFGQSGARADLYRHYGIDAAAIERAARLILGHVG